MPSKTQVRARGDVPNGGSVALRFALDTGAGRLEVWHGRNEDVALSIRTPTGSFGPYPGSRSRVTGLGFRVSHYRGGDDFYGSGNDRRLLLVDFDGAAGGGEYVLTLEHPASSGGPGIRFDASVNTPYGETGRFLNFVTPGSIWRGATAFRNVAPNSYVIRTDWVDVDGFQRARIGEEIGNLWTGSGVGPTVDGRLGVDVSAPGDKVVTTYAPHSYWATARWNLIAGALADGFDPLDADRCPTWACGGSSLLSIEAAGQRSADARRPRRRHPAEGCNLNKGGRPRDAPVNGAGGRRRCGPDACSDLTAEGRE